MGRGFRVLGVGCVLLAIAAPAALAAPTRGEYIAQADPVCHAGILRSARIRNAQGRALRVGDFREAARKNSALVRNLAATIQKLAAIEPPSADAAALQDWLDALREELPIARRATGALRREKPGRYLKIEQKLRLKGSEAQGLIEIYGFSSCDNV